jgi:hypothetical protein
MSDDKKNGDRSFRMLFKRISRVKASDDFEKRLYERIESQQCGKKHKNIFESLVIYPYRRMPVYVLSAAVMIAVCIMSYYIYLRTGTKPTQSLAMKEEMLQKKSASASETMENKKELNTHSAATKVVEKSTDQNVSSYERTIPEFSIKNKIEMKKSLPTGVTKEYDMSTDEKGESVTLSEKEDREEKKLEGSLKKSVLDVLQGKATTVNARSEKFKALFKDSTSNPNCGEVDSLKMEKH